MSATISARPVSIGAVALTSLKPWVVSWAAPMNAAAQPTAARAMAVRSVGALGSAGGASSNVRTAISSASRAIPATIQNSGRQAWASACTPPRNGPSATAPNTHMFMMTAVLRSLSRGKPMVSGGAAAISSMLVAKPCAMWPVTNMAWFWAAAASIDPAASVIA